MSEFEVFIDLPGNQYDECIFLDKYGEQYGLILGRKGNKGTNFKQWCFPEYQKKPREKAVPWRIPLGRRDDAVEVIAQIAKAFGCYVAQNEKNETPAPETDIDGSEIPF